MSGRSIAPRPAFPPDGFDNTTTYRASFPAAGGSDVPQSTLIQTRESPSANAGTNTRKKVTSACQGCQKRRVKCDGNLPCATCTRTKSECSYTRELDGRSIKRKYHEVQRDQDLLNELLDTIRTADNEDVSQLVSLIRSEAPIEEVKACITQQLVDIRLAGCENSSSFKQLQQNLEFLKTETGERIRPSPRPDVLGIRRLADHPLHKLSAAPWTSVTNDDDLVSNLISSWLTWDKGWQDLIDEDLLVRDWQSGDTESMFCSPFLVNCLLAWCCPYSDYKEARTANGSASPLMLEFIEESKRLLEKETFFGLCLTTVQGLMLLHASLTVVGQDQYAYRFLVQAMGTMSDLMSSPISTRSHHDPQVARELASAMDRTSWGVYGNSTHLLTVILKPQMMKAPRTKAVDWGYKRPHYWRPYPFSDEPIQSHREDIFEWGCDYALIQAELSQILFNVQEKLPRAQLEVRILSMHETMQHKFDRIPRYLQVGPRSPPGVLMQHIRFHSIALRMLLPLRERVEHASPEVVSMASRKCLQASLDMAYIFRIFTEAWGATNIGIVACHEAVMSLSVLMDEPDILIYSQQITDIIVVMRAMSRRWPFVIALLRMLQLDARSRGCNFPPETIKLFEEFEDSTWKLRETKRFVSVYPMPETSKAGVVTEDDIGMGKFLEAMEALELKDIVTTPSRRST